MVSVKHRSPFRCPWLGGHYPSVTFTWLLRGSREFHESVLKSINYFTKQDGIIISKSFLQGLPIKVRIMMLITSRVGEKSVPMCFPARRLGRASAK